MLTRAELLIHLCYEIPCNNGIAFVEKFENPPNAPQIRPIENYWGILKMKVYEGSWRSFNSMHQNEAKGNQSRYCD
jgi:hypothetical protein